MNLKVTGTVKVNGKVCHNQVTTNGLKSICGALISQSPVQVTNLVFFDKNLSGLPINADINSVKSAFSKGCNLSIKSSSLIVSYGTTGGVLDYRKLLITGVLPAGAGNFLSDGTPSQDSYVVKVGACLIINGDTSQDVGVSGSYSDQYYTPTGDEALLSVVLFSNEVLKYPNKSLTITWEIFFDNE